MQSKADETPRTGLRERKKEQTRRAIAEAARAMFEKRGYDAVTVAEIADASNVSVKTLFTYFASKEDLVFDDENGLRDQILARIKGRTPGESALEAVGSLLRDLLFASSRRSTVAALDGFRRMVDSPAILSRLRLMWDRYEEALSDLLAAETGSAPHDPTPRMAAAQLISLFRLLGSDELRAYVGSHRPREQHAALQSWLDSSLRLLAEGLRDYGRGDRGDDIGSI